MKIPDNPGRTLVLTQPVRVTGAYPVGGEPPFIALEVEGVSYSLPQEAAYILAGEIMQWLETFREQWWAER